MKMEENSTIARHRFDHMPLHRIVWNRIVSTLWNEHPLEPEARVLDVRCGMGEYALYLRANGFQGDFVGVDSSSSLIRIAKAQEMVPEKSKYLVADAEKLPFGRESFDYVVSAFAMHDWWNPKQSLREIRRVLSPNGKLILVDLHREGLIGRMATYLEAQGGGYGLFTRSQIWSFLQESGFQNVFFKDEKVLYDTMIIG